MLRNKALTLIDGAGLPGSPTPFDDRYPGKQGIEGYTSVGSNRLCVYFNGSDHPMDWFRHVLLKPIDVSEFEYGREDIKIHSAWWDLYWHPSVRDTLINLIRDYDVDKVLIGGHSFGGAVAALFAYDLRMNLNQDTLVQCVTFGAPKVGNRAWTRRFNDLLGINAVHYVNGRDPVPHLPFTIPGILPYYPMKNRYTLDRRKLPTWLVPSVDDHYLDRYYENLMEDIS